MEVDTLLMGYGNALVPNDVLSPCVVEGIPWKEVYSAHPSVHFDEVGGIPWKVHGSVLIQNGALSPWDACGVEGIPLKEVCSVHPLVHFDEVEDIPCSVYGSALVPNDVLLLHGACEVADTPWKVVYNAHLLALYVVVVGILLMVVCSAPLSVLGVVEVNILSLEYDIALVLNGALLPCASLQVVNIPLKVYDNVPKENAYL